MANEDPISASVAGRYASALFDLANEARNLPQVEQDVKQVQRLLDESEDLRRMVRSPVISSDDQGKAITSIADRSGLSPLCTNFLRLLAKNCRLFVLSDVLKSFRQIVARHRGEITAEVASAHPLNEAQLTALKEALRGTAAGKDVNVTTKVDPQLLGGLIIKMGSRMLDSSLRTKLDTLKTRMKEVR